MAKVAKTVVRNAEKSIKECLVTKRRATGMQVGGLSPIFAVPIEGSKEKKCIRKAPSIVFVK